MSVEDLRHTRPSVSEWMHTIADAVATRADCRRRKAAAVIFDRDNRIVSTGYNGAPAGAPGCLAGACPRGLLSYDEIGAHSDYEKGPGRCVAIHAEANAIIHADYERMRGGTIVITCEPCPGCRKLIAATPLRVVLWPDDSYYQDRL